MPGASITTRAVSTLLWLWRWALRGAHAALVLLLALFGALAIGQLPVNRDFRQPDEGVELFVYVDSAHSEIILPLSNEIVDWTPWFSANDFQEVTGDEEFASFGWGDREFFLNTERWSDMRSGCTTRAMLWPTSTVMHVSLDYRPVESKFYHRLVISPEAYRRMVEKIQSSFALTGTRLESTLQPKLIPGRSYGSSDAFYEARGIYSMFYTCNAWTGDVLQVAGVRTGLWTPTPAGILQLLDESGK